MSAHHFAPEKYLDLEQTEHAALFAKAEQAWDVLLALDLYLRDAIKPANHGRMIGHPVIGAKVFIGEGTVVEPGAYIKGPAWIGENCQIRHGAYIRENVIIGGGSVIGNSTEIKNSVLFQGCQVPHFNYVGDSVLGAKVHLAAGVIVSNLKLTGDFITVRYGDEVITTGLRKFGALIGDGVEVGCNAVINPGSIIGRRSLIYAGVSWRGVLPAHSIAKDAKTVRERGSEARSSSLPAKTAL
jgi:NDP-sugar pyrophosphorylase family protein